MFVQPYLFFNGRCEEALDFYKKALGAQVTMLMRAKDNPEPHDPGSLPPGSGEKILHAAVKIGDAMIFASDGNCDGKPRFEGICLSLSAATTDESQRLFAALADGGKIHVPLGKTFFSPSFGTVEDRFGVVWMVMVPPTQ